MGGCYERQLHEIQKLHFPFSCFITQDVTHRNIAVFPLDGWIQHVTPRSLQRSSEQSWVSTVVVMSSRVLVEEGVFIFLPHSRFPFSIFIHYGPLPVHVGIGSPWQAFPSRFRLMDCSHVFPSLCCQQTFWICLRLLTCGIRAAAVE